MAAGGAAQQARRLSALLLIVSFILHLGGVLLFSANFYGWYIEKTPTYLIWERGLFMAAYVAAALAVALLEVNLSETGAAILARLGATAFVMAAVLALVAEAASLSQQGSMAALVIVMVVLLFIAEAILGRGAAQLLCGAGLDCLDHDRLEHRLARRLAHRLAGRHLLSTPAFRSAASDRRPSCPSRVNEHLTVNVTSDWPAIGACLVITVPRWPGATIEANTSAAAPAGSRQPRSEPALPYGDEGPRVDVPRRGQGRRDRVVSLKRLRGIGSAACEGEVLEVPREQRVRPTNLRGVRMTERTSPSIATVGRDVEEGAAPSNGGAVPWAE